MITSVFIGVLCMFMMIVLAPQISSGFWGSVISICSHIGYLIALYAAWHYEEKLKSRIQALEDKLKDKE